MASNQLSCLIILIVTLIMLLPREFHGLGLRILLVFIIASIAFAHGETHGLGLRILLVLIVAPVALLHWKKRACNNGIAKLGNSHCCGVNFGVTQIW